MYKLRNYLVAGAGSVLLVLALLSVSLRYVSADEKDKFSAPNLLLPHEETIRLTRHEVAISAQGGRCAESLD